MTDLRVEGGRVTGVVLADGVTLSCQSAILTSGTFLNGVIHIGDQQRPGGRIGIGLRAPWPSGFTRWICRWGA